MRLFIAEKPSLGKAIAEVLPGEKTFHKTHIECGDDVVSWCFGHIFELFEPQDYCAEWKSWRLEHLPMVPPEWKKKPKEDAKGQVKILAKLTKDAKVIVHAGDPDREGQLLVDEVLEALKVTKPVLRLWLSATDAASVTKALDSMHPNEQFKALGASAEARSRGDWLVGLNATRRMTVLSPGEVVSVGRVQTPTLGLVVARDAEIRDFKPKAYFTLGVSLKAATEPFTALWEPSEAAATDGEGRVLDRAACAAVEAKIRGKPFKCSQFKQENKQEHAPLPYSLDSLQMEANKKLGLSAKDTLSTVQQLYEAKLVSYPRSDCGYLPESQFSDAPAILGALEEKWPNESKLVNPQYRSKAWNDKKVTAHHGIIPTGVRGELSGTKAEVYNLICLRYLAQFCGAHEYQENTALLECEGEVFRARGKLSLNLGWRKIANFESEENKEGLGQGLPALTVGQSLEPLKIQINEHKTTSPAHFTEASLLAAMLNVHKFEQDENLRKRLKESSGIGTPATRAGIIDTLKRRGFIAQQKKNLIATAKGVELIKKMPAELKSPGLTALFEEELERIANGKGSIEHFVNLQLAMLQRFLAVKIEAKPKPEPESKPCPKCSGSLVKKRSKYGDFFGCRNYPACTYIIALQPPKKTKKSPSSRGTSKNA